MQTEAYRISLLYSPPNLTLPAVHATHLWLVAMAHAELKAAHHSELGNHWRLQRVGNTCSVHGLLLACKGGELLTPCVLILRHASFGFYCVVYYRKYNIQTLEIQHGVTKLVWKPWYDYSGTVVKMWQDSVMVTVGLQGSSSASPTVNDEPLKNSLCTLQGSSWNNPLPSAN